MNKPIVTELKAEADARSGYQIRGPTCVAVFTGRQTTSRE